MATMVKMYFFLRILTLKLRILTFLHNSDFKVRIIDSPGCSHMPFVLPESCWKLSGNRNQIFVSQKSRFELWDAGWVEVELDKFLTSAVTALKLYYYKFFFIVQQHTLTLPSAQVISRSADGKESRRTTFLPDVPIRWDRLGAAVLPAPFQMESVCHESPHCLKAHTSILVSLSSSAPYRNDYMSLYSAAREHSHW